MNKNSLSYRVVILFVFFLFSNVYSQDIEILWTKYITESVLNETTDFIVNKDEITIVGSAGKVGGDYLNTDIWIIKYNTNGEFEQSKTYGGVGYEEALSITSTECNRKYVLIHTSDSEDWLRYSDNTKNTKFVLVLDSLNERIRTLTLPSQDFIKIVALEGERILAVGSSDSSMILDSNGSISEIIPHSKIRPKNIFPYNKKYLINSEKHVLLFNPETGEMDTIFVDNTQNRYPIEKVNILSNGDIIVVGYTLERDLTDAYIYCFDTLGNSKWKKYLGKRSWDFFTNVTATDQDDIIVLANLWRAAGLNFSIDGHSAQQIVIYNKKGKKKRVIDLKIHTGKPIYISKPIDGIFYVIGKGDSMRPYLMKCKLYKSER